MGKIDRAGAEDIKNAIADECISHESYDQCPFSDSKSITCIFDLAVMPSNLKDYSVL